MRSILFVDRDSLFYFGGDVKNIVPIQVPPTAVHDMEVINAEELVDIFTKTIQANKLKPADILIMFSFRSSFQKDVVVAPLQKEVPKGAPPPVQEPIPPTKDITLQIQEFNETVPFNRVLSKPFTQNKKTTIIAINKDYAYALRDVLEANAYKLEGIVPSFALYGDQQLTMSVQAAQQMLKHYNSLQQVSYPIHETEKQTLAEAEEAEFAGEKPHRNTRLYVMLGVFGVLIILLIGMYFLYRRPKATASQSVNPSPPVATKTPVSPTPTPPEQTPTPAIAKNELTFQVLNGSGIPGQADLVQERLAEAGFENIAIGNAPTQAADKASVVFKPEVARAHRDEIVTMIKSLGFDVGTRENTDISTDVLITTYQPPEE